MPTVELVVVDAKKGLIKAPSFCPYKEWLSKETIVATIEDPFEVVNASLCSQCGICTFVHKPVENIGVIIPKLSEKIDKKIVDAIKNYQDFLTSVVGQIKYLQKNDRIPLAVLISFSILDNVLRENLNNEDYENAIKHYTQTDCHLLHISGLPVYFSSKLTKSPVMVIGEIEWNNL